MSSVYSGLSFPQTKATPSLPPGVVQGFPGSLQVWLHQTRGDSGSFLTLPLRYFKPMVLKLERVLESPREVIKNTEVQADWSRLGLGLCNFNRFPRWFWYVPKWEPLLCAFLPLCFFLSHSFDLNALLLLSCCPNQIQFSRLDLVPIRVLSACRAAYHPAVQ